MFAVARVAAPTVEAGRNVSSSPVSEAVSEVRPPGAVFASRDRVRAWRFTDEPQRENDQRHLQDCAAGRDLHGCDTPRIQHHESLAVSTAQNPGGLGQRGDDMVDGLSFATRIAILVGDINVVTADEPDTKHDRFHVPHTTTPRRRPPGVLGSPGATPSTLGRTLRREGPDSGRSGTCGWEQLQPGELLPTQRHGVTVSVGMFDPVWDPLCLLACAAASPGHELAPFGSHSACHDPHDRA